MRIYFTKKDLYKKVEEIRYGFGIDNSFYPLDCLNFCRKEGILVGSMSFKTAGIRGMVQMGDSYNPPVIILNALNSPEENNFYCGHELMHAIIHRDLECPSFKCYDTINDKRNDILEWQANEGAAELLLPYKHFIPRLMEVYNQLDYTVRMEKVKDILAQEYGVTASIIELRIKNLKFEIDQYRTGVPLDKIVLMSQNQLKNHGVHVKSLFDLENEKIMEELHRWQARKRT